MTTDHTRARAIQELGEAVKGGHSGIFVGSGISSTSGLPSWATMLKEMINLLEGQPGVHHDLISDARALLADKNKWLSLGQLLKDELGKSFTDYIARRFTDTSIKPNEIHDAIVDTPWRVIVTTNYDRLIERTFSKKYGDEGDVPVLTYTNPGGVASNYRRGERFVLKAHGDAKERPESIVLTERDYRQLIHREIGYQTILQALFTTNSFLFVGSSLSDPDLKLLLSFIHSAFHGDTPTHYALMPADERLDAEDRVFYKEFSIHVIPIDPANREAETLNFLKDLAKATV
jgi:hypothetical protein